MMTISIAGLFAGIGGLELGLNRAGHETHLLCEVDPAASKVLERHFPEPELVGDVRKLRELPPVDLVTAGFPCTDLSQAGRTVGIAGNQSGLVSEVFRLVSDPRRSPTWLLLENVPFMLQLQKGRAMRFVTDSLEELGFAWAYRIIDTRAFGLPQRRKRVLLLASRTEDPRQVLLGQDAGEAVVRDDDFRLCGFYWTEGLRGLGWANDAIPTLKSGSTIGIPSPPAIWNPDDGSIGTPDIRDAERLQGFPPRWTEAASRRQGTRWRLVGNAVSVPVAKWVGEAIVEPGPYVEGRDEILEPGARWPKAAWGKDGKVHTSDVSSWPIHARYQHLDRFLRYPLRPLSHRGAAGFLGRLDRGRLRFREDFHEDLVDYVKLAETQKTLP